MPIAADLPPNWKVPVQEVRSTYALEGSVGKDLAYRLGQVVSHWQNRPGYSIDLISDEDDPINHVPFKKAGVIKVHFRSAQPMRPRSLDFGASEEE